MGAPFRYGQTDERLPRFQPVFFPLVALSQLEIVSTVQGMYKDCSTCKGRGNLFFS